MDYRDASDIERDRVTHYNRTFGRTNATPAKRNVEPWKPIDIESLDGSEKWTPEEKTFLDNLYNG
jgi:hypothetical protein